jgi:uncharacterized membrane protein
MKGFKFQPVKWMTLILGILGGVVAVNETLVQLHPPVHLIPEQVMAYVSTAVVIITVVLGVLTHNRTTPVADPKTTIDGTTVPLVPKPSAIPADATSPVPDPQR